MRPAVHLAAAAGIAAIALPMIVVTLIAADPLATAQPAGVTVLGGEPSAYARRDIPASYLKWYTAAARTCPGLPWSVLAGIGKAASDHGRSAPDRIRSGKGSTRPEGPMQLLPASFARYAVNADPGHALTPYDPPDAIYTAARILCADGARGGTITGLRDALLAIGHTTSYVTDVLTWAVRYTAVTVARRAATAIAFAEAQLGKPYCWGGQGPGCFDCSGLVYAAYGTAGISIGRTTYQWEQDGPQVPLSQIQPGDLLFSAGSDGTAASPGHVVMYLGGDRVIQAPQAGQDIQIDPLDITTVVVATRPADLAASP